MEKRPFCSITHRYCTYKIYLTIQDIPYYNFIKYIAFLYFFIFYYTSHLVDRFQRSITNRCIVKTSNTICNAWKYYTHRQNIYQRNLKSQFYRKIFSSTKQLYCNTKYTIYIQYYNFMKLTNFWPQL